ncbi:MAG TPA: hypothetical protein VIR59_09420 [Gaiellaceae bacterium]
MIAPATAASANRTSLRAFMFLLPSLAELVCLGFAEHISPDATEVLGPVNRWRPRRPGLCYVPGWLDGLMASRSRLRVYTDTEPAHTKTAPSAIPAPIPASAHPNPLPRWMVTIRVGGWPACEGQDRAWWWHVIGLSGPTAAVAPGVAIANSTTLNASVVLFIPPPFGVIGLRKLR